MIKKRNRFLTFCFSMLPGAGHMFNGFMKRGVSLMLLFFAIWFLAYSVDIYGFGMFAPVIWFFSFFDSMNLRCQPDEIFYAQKDDYLFHLDGLRRFWVSDSKVKPVAGVGLIIIGVYSLIKSVLLPSLYAWGMVSPVLDRFLSSLSYVMPRLIVAVLIIMAGVALIVGKKADLLLNDDQEEDPRYAPDLDRYEFAPDEETGCNEENANEGFAAGDPAAEGGDVQ